MKTKDIAYGGLMVAVFIALNLIFRGNVRVVQTYLEIIKIIVIAVFLRKINSNAWWIFTLACFVSCLFFVSIFDTLIYNIPSIICGITIGLQKHSDRKFRNYLSFFAVHSFMMIYEIVMFGIIMKTNLFTLYREQSSGILALITNGAVNEIFSEIFLVLFIILDSAFSSFVIFTLTQITLQRLNKINRN